MDDCCEGKSSNLGAPTCFVDLKPTVQGYFQRTYKNDGTKNRQNLAALSGTVFKDLLVSTDGSRMYPIGELTDVTYPLGDSAFQTAANQKTKFLRGGLRGFAASLWGSISTWITKGKLEYKRCGAWSFYPADTDNNLVGATDGNYFFGIPIDEQSMDPKFMFPVDDAGQMNMLGFNFDRNFKDKTLYVINGDNLINASDGTPDPINFIDPSTVIIDAKISILDVTETTVEFIVNTDYRMGSKNQQYEDRGNVKGLIIDDIALFNVSDQLAALTTSLDEYAPGLYTLTFVEIVTPETLLELQIVPLGVKAIEYEGAARFSSL